MAHYGSHRLQFGQFYLDLATRELFHGSLKLPLQDKPFSILALLLQHPHQLISREQLMAAVWPEVHVGADSCLNTAIRKLRAALGETAENARCIETFGKHGYRFVGHIATPAQPSATNGNSSAPVRLAVLPFEDLGAPADGSFTEGMTRHVITRLAHKHNRLAIIAPTSVTRYKRSTRGTVQICNELHADYVLTGSVLRSVGRVRVDVELIERWGQSCIWAETYVRTETDSIVTQDDIARHIINSILRALPKPDRVPAAFAA